MDVEKEEISGLTTSEGSQEQAVSVAEKKIEEANTENFDEYLEIQRKESEEHHVEEVDYSNFSKHAMVDLLKSLVNQQQVGDVRENIDGIKNAFYKLHRNELAEKRQAFLEQGGLQEDFKFEDHDEVEFRELYKKYKDMKSAHNERIEKEKQHNLQKRLAIIEELKELLNKKESIEQTFKEFRDLQVRWKEVGMVPQADIKNIWETYHHHVSKFYDYIKINKELRDLDLKRNFEIKIHLCEKSEELLLEESVVRAFSELQKLHDQWREVGPVPVEKKNELWERFKQASSTINKRHQEYFIVLKEQEKKNFDAKVLICEKIEELLSQPIVSLKDWTEKSNEIIEFQKMWRTIGFAPKKFNNEIYERFRKACDDFFNRKRDFLQKIREEEEVNKQRKIELCIQAEGMQDSTDWKRTTNDFIALQKEWAKIGPVSRKESDKLWKRFRGACDKFFDTKSSHFAGLEQEQGVNLQKKLAIIERVNSLVLSDDQEENLELLKVIQKEWAEIGFIPLDQKDKVQNEFRDAINKKFEVLNIGDNRKKMFKYRVKVDHFNQAKNPNDKVGFERTKLLNKLKALQADIVLLENNIGFFSKSANADALIGDVKAKIERGKQEIETIQQQLKLLKEFESKENNQ